MPVRSASPSQETPARKKFRTVVGFHSSHPHSNQHHLKSHNTNGGSLGRQRRRRANQSSSISDAEFFEREAIIVDDSDNVPPDHRAQIKPQAAMRAPVRMDAQDGPWSVSVAESPHDSRAYSLYIKTPTHNLTLTRTAMEILELDNKLREGNPNAKLPALPIDSTSLPAAAATPKRKSTFLTTLSRLASPSAKSSKQPRQVTPSSGPTPITSPATEAQDPFLAFAVDDSSLPAPSAVSTALAAYLTTVSNTPGLRQTRVWKRFVRVRTDDLESVRVERAIKRVRSDLAAHTGAANKEAKERPKTIIKEEDISFDEKPEEPTEEEEELQEEVAETATPTTDLKQVKGEEENEKESKPVEEEEPTTPSQRVHRSQSADPDKSSRLTRTFTSSTTAQDSEHTETGDDSSVSTSARRRRTKKRSKTKLTKQKKKVVIDDFEMMRVLGKGCAGKVLLVKHKSSTDLYALKAITKRHVLAHQELQHTLTEQAVLKRMAAESKDPFVVKLWWSFHDKENLFLVMDFHPGGDLATQLARWGRLGRDRARFYAAEIVEGVEGLHAAGVIYRDLKPENILIGADGHIVLTDFGLSKEFPRRMTAVTAPPTPRGEFFPGSPSSSGSTAGTPTTCPPWMKGGEMGWPGPPPGQDSTTTFCGTAEYLAPEVIQGQSYSYEIDWWSFGTMLFEMLTGITPFWAANHSDMYVRVLQDELQFPDDRAIDQDTKSLIRGLLQKNPALRMCEPRIKKHPYFSMIDWSHVYYKRYIPPYIPPIDPSNASDTQNFDDTFLDMQPVLDDPYENENEQTDTDQDQTDAERTDGEESNTTPSQSRSSSVVRQPQQVTETPGQEDEVDVFDGYSFKGRHSVVLEDEEEEEEDGTDEETDEEEVSGAILAPLPPSPLETETPQLDEESEPKTPEARPAALPPVEDGIVPAATPTPIAEPSAEVPSTGEPTKHRKSKEIPRPVSVVETAAPSVPEKDGQETKAVAPFTQKPAPPPAKPRPAARPQRREKSGIRALDKYIEDEDATEQEDEDDDWDFIEADGGEDRNGAKGTSYFARGVVDRYRLAVFKKGSTPTLMSQRSVSTTSEMTMAEPESPLQKRGRNSGLSSFRKGPRQFLKPKSPPSSYSSKASGKSMHTSTSVTSSGLLTPSPSVPPGSPSLKSRESATSVGALSSSDQSLGETVETTGPADTIKGSPQVDDKQKNKKLKKYKEGAEKMLSIFSGSSPRQPQQQS